MMSDTDSGPFSRPRCTRQVYDRISRINDLSVVTMAMVGAVERFASLDCFVSQQCCAVFFN